MSGWKDIAIVTGEKPEPTKPETKPSKNRWDEQEEKKVDVKWDEQEDIMSFQNSKVFVEYRRKLREIYARDLTDANNEPAVITKSKRGIIKLWAHLLDAYTAHPDAMTHRDVMTAMTWAGVKYHYWCGMD